MFSFIFIYTFFYDLIVILHRHLESDEVKSNETYNKDNKCDINITFFK